MVALSELYSLLTEGENSGVEFERDDIRPEVLAKEMVALSKLRGGRVLLGVEDDGRVSGAARGNIEEWALTVARDKVRPPLIPYFEQVTNQASGHRVAVITVKQGYALPVLISAEAPGRARRFCGCIKRAIRPDCVAGTGGGLRRHCSTPGDARALRAGGRCRPTAASIPCSNECSK